MNTRDTTARVRGVSQCAKIQYCTRTHVTCGKPYSSLSDEDPVNVTVNDGMHPPNPNEAHSILDDAEDEEMMTEQRKLRKELRVAQKEASQMKNSLTAVDIMIMNVMNNMVAVDYP